MSENSLRTIIGGGQRRAIIEPEIDEYQAFSFGRIASRNQAMVCFRRLDGYVEALSYASLDRIWTSDIHRRIELEFGLRKVRIDGTNLALLFRYLADNRCSEVLELDRLTVPDLNSGDTLVTQIVIEAR